MECLRSGVGEWWNNGVVVVGRMGEAEMIEISGGKSNAVRRAEGLSHYHSSSFSLIDPLFPFAQVSQYCQREFRNCFLACER